MLSFSPKNKFRPKFLIKTVQVYKSLSKSNIAKKEKELVGYQPTFKIYKNPNRPLNDVIDFFENVI
jgi:hypothetical protein